MSNIFLSQPILGGHSWTIITKLGAMLREAQSRFGDRDKSYTIIGVELTTANTPQVWYPGDCKHIGIQITMNCIMDMNRAVYQVAHEAIHCLSPIGSSDVNVLEEGLATLFSIEYTRDNNHGDWTSGHTSYDHALNLTGRLLSFDEEIIIKVRQRQPTISLITTEDLLSINPKIPFDLADALTAKFNRDA
jgi:hypothetical protein